jgi:hypothetical protein
VNIDHEIWMCRSLDRIAVAVENLTEIVGRWDREYAQAKDKLTPGIGEPQVAESTGEKNA